MKRSNMLNMATRELCVRYNIVRKAESWCWNSVHNIMSSNPFLLSSQRSLLNPLSLSSDSLVTYEQVEICCIANRYTITNALWPMSGVTPVHFMAFRTLTTLQIVPLHFEHDVTQATSVHASLKKRHSTRHCKTINRPLHRPHHNEQ